MAELGAAAEDTGLEAAEEAVLDGGRRGAPRLFVRRWRPGGAAAEAARGAGDGGGEDDGAGSRGRGVIAIVPGFNDHGGRYGRLVAFARERGYGVAALDTRGHGRSSGPRGHVTTFRDYEADVERFLAWVRKGAPGAPVILWAHSMGGVIGLAFLSAGYGRGLVDAAVIASPALGVTVRVPAWKVRLARVLDRAWPGAPFASEVNPPALSRDAAIAAAYLADPLVHHTCTPRLYLEMGRAARRLLAAPVDYGIPTLLLQGEADSVVSPEATRRYVDRSALRVKALRLYPDARHELHNDTNAREVFEDAFAFVERHVPQRQGQNT